MSQILVLPLIIPLLTAIVALLAQRWRQAQRWISVLGAAALLATTLALLATVWRDGIQVVQIGN
jgi:multicomponent Na+:H+ antiporter subunit D